MITWISNLLAQVLFGQRFGCDVRFAAEKMHGGLGIQVVLERNQEK